MTPKEQARARARTRAHGHSISRPSNIINVAVEKWRSFLKQRRGGWEPAANGEALINNLCAQLGAKIAHH